MEYYNNLIILIVLSITLISSIKTVAAKTFSECELAVELVKNGFPREKLDDWVCLVEHESGRDTAAVGGPNKNKTYDYGLFQINDGRWCEHNKPGKGCNISCEALIDDDITDDCKCAELIYSKQNFSAWFGWLNHCKGRPMTNVSYCFNTSITISVTTDTTENLTAITTTVVSDNKTEISNNLPNKTIVQNTSNTGTNSSRMLSFEILSLLSSVFLTILCYQFSAKL